MRMMMKSQLAVDATSLAIADGTIGQVFDKVFAAAKPEATYFLTEGGRRTVYAIFDMTSPDIIPLLAEPMFQSLGAEVAFFPVMSANELQKGLAGWAANR